MLYHVLDYDQQTKIAYGVEASMFNPENMEFLERYIVGLYSEENLDIDTTHSFYPCNFWLNNVYIKGTLNANANSRKSVRR